MSKNANFSSSSGIKIDKNKLLFFWGHTPRSNASVGKECLSQWYMSPFQVNGHKFHTAEQYMMFKKAIIFDDLLCAEKVLRSKTPEEAKKLGREVTNFDEKIWIENRFQIVVDANLHKFRSCSVLRAFLLATDDHVLVEASPYDKIWGIGLDAGHADSANPNKWRGLNLLGFALMDVRKKLREENLKS
ncbi:NADAR family protein [Grimontia marina]|uniref:Swarming motility protein YbiA n=1 Tax=Grimontia marina TaxID=646534 RepID=A0A128FL63_9GAMM|nr:NADAR family protein [Grimontia marina]CZF87014.1 Swarming motility protein YbiA [Grimontia marina]